MNRILVLAIMITVVDSVYPQESASSYPPQKSSIDFDMLMNETQIFLDDPDKMLMVWWLPKEYWIATAEEDPFFDTNMAEETIDVLNPYIVTFIIVGRIGAFGGIKYETIEKIYDNSYLQLSTNHKLYPIKRDKIDPDVINFMEMMKPIFANMMGQMGENMQYVLFNAQYQNGEDYINSKSKDYFKLNVLENEVKFNLPLASIFPKKTCSKCDEILNGTYNYCPFDGTNLE